MGSWLLSLSMEQKGNLLEGGAYKIQLQKCSLKIILKYKFKLVVE
jgi:hypothetical protein